MRGECQNASLPPIDEAWSTRHIAAWYDQHDNLEIIRELADQDELIQPGVVMFYGHASRAALYNYKTMTLQL